MEFSETQKGFTLVELMIVVALVAIMAMIAVPSFNRLINNNRTLAANNELVALLQYARAYAVEHRTSVRVCVDGSVIAVKKLCADTNALRTLSGDSGVSIAASQADIQFRNNGTADQNAFFFTCRDNDAANGFTVTVVPTGMMRTFGRGMQDATTAMSGCTGTAP